LLLEVEKARHSGRLVFFGRMDVGGETAPPNPSKRCAITDKEYSISRDLIIERAQAPRSGTPRERNGGAARRSRLSPTGFPALIGSRRSFRAAYPHASTPQRVFRQWLPHPIREGTVALGLGIDPSLASGG
jgi:hypothetical protein